VSHKRLGEIQAQLRLEVAALLQLSQPADGLPVAPTVDLAAEVARRQQKIDQLAQAQTVLHSRAQVRYELEQAAYTEKMAERAAHTARTGRKPRGRVPLPPFLPSVMPSSTIDLSGNF
jgi:hypothetical protein